MTKQEFKKLAKEVKGWDIFRIQQTRNIGFYLTYSQTLGENTVSTEITKFFPADSVEELTKYLYN